MHAGNKTIYNLAEDTEKEREDTMEKTPNPQTVIAVTAKVNGNTVKRNVDYMQIDHINDTYYETELHMDDGELIVIQETYKKLRDLIHTKENQK